MGDPVNNFKQKITGYTINWKGSEMKGRKSVKRLEIG